MFGIGMPEMLLLLAVALIVFGPKKLPELAKSMARALGEFKRATSDLKETIETETGINEVRDSINEVKDDFKAQVDLAGSTPEPSTPPSEAKLDDETEAPLDKVKAAFDDMNTDSDDSDTETSDDPEPESQETKTQ